MLKINFIICIIAFNISCTGPETNQPYSNSSNYAGMYTRIANFILNNCNKLKCYLTGTYYSLPRIQDGQATEESASGKQANPSSSSNNKTKNKKRKKARARKISQLLAKDENGTPKSILELNSASPDTPTFIVTKERITTVQDTAVEIFSGNNPVEDDAKGGWTTVYNDNNGSNRSTEALKKIDTITLDDIRGKRAFRNLDEIQIADKLYIVRIGNTMADPNATLEDARFTLSFFQKHTVTVEENQVRPILEYENAPHISVSENNAQNNRFHITVGEKDEKRRYYFERNGFPDEESEDRLKDLEVINKNLYDEIMELALEFSNNYQTSCY